MPLTEYEVRVNVWGDIIRVRIRTERGQVVDFVAQYEAWIGGQRRPIVRHDASHGRAHRDLLDWQGHPIRKEWVAEHVGLAAALTAAIADLRDNWPTYFAAYLRRRP